ncbi:hypothetical protein MUP46_02165 [Patescibacteria group bacterium]|nr:hypothetical protein [Patescibacteria group bacterium]
MTTLSRVAVTTRKIVRYGIFFLIFLIIGRIGLTLGTAVYRHFYPKPPPAPTVSYGKLPKLPFPDRAKINLNFSLETPEGGLPTLPTQAKVFSQPKLSPNLLSLDMAKEKAASLGFDPSEQSISSTIYKFKNKNSEATLEMNIVTGIFSISYDLKKDSSPIEKKPPAPEIAASIARSYLSSASLLPDDLSGPTTHEFLKINGDKFDGALSLAESDIVKIHLYRKSYDNLPSLPPDPNQANVWFMVSGALVKEKQIIAAELHYFPVDETQFSTYPIKTAQTAWDELTGGKVFVATYGINKNGDSVKIRRVYLAYYDSNTQAQFFQPIIVFEGDNGFVAYDPAVTSDYYGE